MPPRLQADDISPEDEAALAAFMTPAALDGSGAAAQRTLADAIMARLQEQQDASGEKQQHEQHAHPQDGFGCAC